MSRIAISAIELRTGAAADIDVQARKNGGRVSNTIAALGRFASGSWEALLHAEAAFAMAACATPEASISSTATTTR
ncbi:MAG: hypothetical protein ACXWC4_02910 [Telluria sp.]